MIRLPICYADVKTVPCDSVQARRELISASHAQVNVPRYKARQHVTFPSKAVSIDNMNYVITYAVEQINRSRIVMIKSYEIAKQLRQGWICGTQ